MTDYAALYAGMRDYTGKRGRSGKYGGGKVRGMQTVVDLVKRTKPRNLLDYGSGQGYQYLASRAHDVWGGLLPYCYDIGVRQLSERPVGQFDGIICSDVLEHIEEADVDDVLADIFGFSAWRPVPAQSFVYFHISTAPAKRSLPDGRNQHLTVHGPDWWLAKLEPHHRDGLIIEARFRPRHGEPAAPEYPEEMPC